MKEALLGLLNGMLVGISAGIGMYIVATMQKNPDALKLALIVFAAMIGSCVVSGISGAIIPLTLRRLGADPATASSIFLTTATDVASMGYFSDSRRGLVFNPALGTRTARNAESVELPTDGASRFSWSGGFLPDFFVEGFFRVFDAARRGTAFLMIAAARSRSGTSVKPMTAENRFPSTCATRKLILIPASEIAVAKAHPRPA